MPWNYWRKRSGQNATGEPSALAGFFPGMPITVDAPTDGIP